ncbi:MULTISPECIES: hypothetical protein [unclassified Bradyrhizobium]|uniref:hypothetical protein n=1 Tax=unclassified Bradyrhizobium TaxID=2631580 RepID=UPI0028E51FCB|nr:MULTISPECIES: hypothetical protein [unclassified Bradyrhizobium]
MSYIFELALAAMLLFFLFLPITDRRTVMMKLCMIMAVAILFTVTLAVPHGVAPSAQVLRLTAN